jgi:hypothetical protein
MGAVGEAEQAEKAAARSSSEARRRAFFMVGPRF